MESVLDTPAKRRKMENGHVPDSRGYNSQDDSGDEYFKDIPDFETVPLPTKAAPDTAHDTYTLTAPTQYITQPTQILEITPSKIDSSSTVQVAASSPIRSPAIPIRSSAPAPLRTSMAPPGTVYRAPPGIKPPPPKKYVASVILSDSEGPTYVGSSSDEEDTLSRGNIKPSSFIMAAQNQKNSFVRKKEEKKGLEKEEHVEPDPAKKMQTIISKLVYNPEKANKERPGLQGSVYDSRNRDESNRSSRIPGTAYKRSADVLANSYGGSDRPAKMQRQTGPAKTMPILNMSLDDIKDPNTRNKVTRMLETLPDRSVGECYAVLVAKKYQEQDALDYLCMQPEQTNITNDVDELSSSQPTKAKPSAKQQIKAPRKNIQDKWAPGQAAVHRKAEVDLVSSPVAEGPKPRRRLIQGRKKARTPTPEPVAKPEPIPQHVRKQNALSISSDSDGDSGLGSEIEAETTLDTQLLAFFNTCSVADLSDLAEISDEISTMLISKRPFKSLAEVRLFSTLKKPSKARNPTKPVGEKIVDKCEEMWAGYASVDELVRTVENLGKPLAEAMKKWGVDVFGKSDKGELEILNVNLKDVTINGDVKNGVKSLKDDATKDSGLGTPSSSNNVSADEHSDAEITKDTVPRTKLSAFFPQPAMMAEGVELKDYQVVGINWLSLLFENRLSCILADDMGLGKTCQVVAFLAHLYEKGEKGPHLIVVPASTLENWLREFSLFCPFLEVMPYYGNLRVN